MQGTCDSEFMSDFLHEITTGSKDSVFGTICNPQQLGPIDRKTATQGHRDELLRDGPSLVVPMGIDRDEDSLGNQILRLDHRNRTKRAFYLSQWGPGRRLQRTEDVDEKTGQTSIPGSSLRPECTHDLLAHSERNRSGPGMDTEVDVATGVAPLGVELDR